MNSRLIGMLSALVLVLSASAAHATLFEITYTGDLRSDWVVDDLGLFSGDVLGPSVSLTFRYNRDAISADLDPAPSADDRSRYPIAAGTNSFIAAEFSSGSFSATADMSQTASARVVRANDDPTHYDRASTGLVTWTPSSWPVDGTRVMSHYFADIYLLPPDPILNPMDAEFAFTRSDGIFLSYFQVEEHTYAGGVLQDTLSSRVFFLPDSAVQTSVPEPSCLILMLMGLAGLGLARRKKTPTPR